MSNLSTLFDRYKALVVFDTETSGLDFDSDQIIELAALRVERTATGGLRIAGKMDTFIKLPEGETLPENIVSLTGITDERLQTEGVQPVKAAGQIAKLMQNGPTLMIAHNAQFDACFLRGLLRGQKVGRIDWLDSLTVYKDRRAYPHKLANAIIDRYNEWQVAALGRDINPDQLRKRILSPSWGENLTGAFRVDVVKPTYKALDDTQVAKFSGHLTVSHKVESEVV